MELSEYDLISAAKNGSDSAFEELIYRYDKSVLAIALNYFQDRDTAKDIYQDVLIRVYRGLKNFEMRSEFSTWLFRITTNVCLTYKSREKRRDFISLDDEFETDDDEFNKFEIQDTELNPGETADSSDIGEFIQDAVDSLSSKQKMTFVLKHYEGYKIKEIAEMLNCKEGTVKKYLFDAVRNLRKKLELIYQTAY